MIITNQAQSMPFYVMIILTYWPILTLLKSLRHEDMVGLVRGYVNCFESTLSSFRLKASCTVSKVRWTLIQEKLEPQTIHNWNLRRQHTCYAEDDFAELLNDRSFQLEFSEQSLCHFLLEKNKKWMSSQFWSSRS